MLVTLFIGALACGVSAQDIGQDTEPKTLNGTVEQEIPAYDATQGVAVGKDYVYAVTNSRITKVDKRTGELLLQFDAVDDEGEASGPILHMDSGVIVDDKLYASHSNWPLWPMGSSVEVFDAETLEHLGTHSFGIQLGSFTWLDRYNDSWWGTFANYDRYQPGAMDSYGKGYNTQVVRMDDEWQIQTIKASVQEMWMLPTILRERFEIMSNSGGSWGPDNRLYLTGHDPAEAYVMELPDAGAVLKWVATVTMPRIEGQGIAWDRFDDVTKDSAMLWGILRPEKMLVKTKVPLQKGPVTKDDSWYQVHDNAKNFYGAE